MNKRIFIKVETPGDNGDTITENYEDALPPHLRFLEDVLDHPNLSHMILLLGLTKITFEAIYLE